MTTPITLAGDRPIRAVTPLGGTVLTPVKLVGEEEVSRPFLFTVDFVSPNPSVGPADVLGKPITLGLPLADGDERRVHGLVRRFTKLETQRGLTRYRAEIVPGFWFLTLSGGNRTLENHSIPDIVEDVCRVSGVKDFKRQLFTPAERPPVPYVVQYEESDFHFVSRLLEEAGIHYVFEHEEDADTLVITDAIGSLIPEAKAGSLRLSTKTAGGAGRPPNSVFDLARDFAVNPRLMSVSSVQLLSAGARAESPSETAGARGLQFHYLGDLGPTAKELPDEALHRMQLLEVGQDVLRGRSNSPALQPGTRVRLVDAGFPPGDDVFRILSVRHSVEIGDVLAGGGFAASYVNEFTAMPAHTFYRPPRLTTRPSVQGTQSAVVVGKGNAGDIDVDEHGRVLLQFPWDQRDGRDGKSRHRVHVASVWAGAGWGFAQLPRIGQRVLVEFLEGDPARPIVTGRVYTDTHRHPFELPNDKTVSGVKTRTVGAGPEHFNELSFEDAPGKERVFVQAERDLRVNVKNDETRTIGHSRQTTIKHDDFCDVEHGTQSLHVIEGSQQIVVEKGRQQLEVDEGNQRIVVAQGTQTVEILDGDQTFNVQKGDQTFVVQDGDRVIDVQNGSNTTTVQVGTITIRAVNDDIKVHADIGDVDIKADAGKVKIEAAMELELKVGPCSIKLTPQGIEIKGPQLKLDATAQAELTAPVVKVEGSAMLQMKGPMSQIAGDALLTAKGGVTMIN